MPDRRKVALLGASAVVFNGDAAAIQAGLLGRTLAGRPVAASARCQLVKLACKRVDDEQAPFRDAWTHNDLGLARTADLRLHRMRLRCTAPIQTSGPRPKPSVA